MPAETLDALGLKCPLPVLRARKILTTLSTGDRLTVFTDDPGAGPDFLAFCEASGNLLIAQESIDEQLTIVIEKT
jgi:TusA-related sulfurtransferase